MEVWKMFFDEICYLDYLTSLPSSIEQFLGEIYCLTMNFCVRKTQRIRELQTKLFELRRVLSISNDDPDDDWERGHMSLDRKLTQLQQRINSLTQQLNERKLLMEEYTREEIQLLNDLGEAAPQHEPLCAHPETGVLPDAAKMAQFADYLCRLRAEKVKRIVTRDKLQSEIRKKAQLLDWVPRKDRHRQLINEQTLIPSLSNLNELQHLDFVLSGLLERKRQQEQQNQQQNSKQPVKKSEQQDGPPDEQNNASDQQQTSNLKEQEPQVNSTSQNSATPSPPPPPPSPASEIEQPAAASASAAAVGTTSGRSWSLFERTIEAYMSVETELGRPADRDKIIEQMFRRFRATINIWWELCLILPNERQQCKVLYTDQLDEDAFVAHIEQQKLLQSYYHENEPIFRLIYQWADLWNRAVHLQRQHTKQQKHNGPDTTISSELEEVNERLASIRKQLEGKCREFEQRCQVKFTMYGMPVMQVLQRCQEKREKLKLPDSCNVQHVLTLEKKAPSSLSEREQTFNEMAVELTLMLKDFLADKESPPELQKKPESESDESNQDTDEDDEERDDDDEEEEEEEEDEDDNEDDDDGEEEEEEDDDDEDDEDEDNEDDDEEDAEDAEDDHDDGDSSDDGGEVNQKRDDELLEEAFASATAAVNSKPRMHSVNGHPAS
uniref:Uncharacterized protein n=1 Tax=Anopheles epiroticus TaxID=199890 RepID=A0A9I3FH91_9DIPT